MKRWLCLRLFADKDGIPDDKADHDNGGDRTDEERDLGPTAKRRPLVVVVIVDRVEGLGAVFGGRLRGRIVVVSSSSALADAAQRRSAALSPRWWI